jgi:DNA-binding response OmpR family regulator
LVVEDEALIALHLREMLGDFGFDDVCCVGDLDTAGRYLDARLPDLAILDINLGRTVVYPFAAALRSRGVPIILATARTTADLPLEWRSAPLVPKPIDPILLLETISGLGLLAPEKSA